MEIHRITLNPKVFQGKPTIRNMRFSVAQLLELLASGMSHEEILADYPYLEKQAFYSLHKWLISKNLHRLPADDFELYY